MLPPWVDEAWGDRQVAQLLGRFRILRYGVHYSAETFVPWLYFISADQQLHRIELPREDIDGEFLETLETYLRMTC
jgi:hypothetical protein